MAGQKLYPVSTYTLSVSEVPANSLLSSHFSTPRCFILDKKTHINHKITHLNKPFSKVLVFILRQGGWPEMLWSRVAMTRALLSPQVKS